MAKEEDTQYFKRYTDTSPPFQTLTDNEINSFFDEIDRDGNGYVEFDELEVRLEAIYHTIAPQPGEYHLHHPSNRNIGGRKKLQDPEKDVPKISPEHDQLHAFLCRLLPECGKSIDRPTFLKRIQELNIPSRDQSSIETEDKKNAEYEHHLPIGRRFKAHWSVEGPQILFMTFVVANQLAFGIWQGVKYVTDAQVQAAFGWGVALAKFAAGALYPTLFYMFLSMSRWFSTYMRRFERLSRFVDWDHHQSFHILMSCEAYVFAVLHAIGHLSGTFVFGSSQSRQDNLENVLGPQEQRMSYTDYLSIIPGWSGLTALALFTVIAILSMPFIRKRSYELFQLGHLLMFPFAAMLCVHGTQAILQPPAMGYVIAFPLALVILERSHRLVRGFIGVPARMEILDDNTVTITCKRKNGKDWRYHAGQYIFLQLPSISLWQWHPFTISMCKGDQLQVHIKCETDGWTEKLRRLPERKDMVVGIDGPFGAPAQRFYNYDKSVIMGAGIGVTPFSAILADLEEKITGQQDPWRSGRSSRRSSIASGSRRSSRSRSRLGSRPGSRAPSVPPTALSEALKKAQDDKTESASRPEAIEQTIAFETPATPDRASNMGLGKKGVSPNIKDDSTSKRVDFIWSVRERNDLLWFSSLLNRVHDLSESASPGLQVNIRPHITSKRKNISAYCFWHLLDRYRAPTMPVSALTGLKMQSHFGRPDLEQLMHDFHEDMREERFSGRVGVFFCGSPVIGRILSDLCQELTAIGRADGSGVRYVFMMEVFN